MSTSQTLSSSSAPAQESPLHLVLRPSSQENMTLLSIVKIFSAILIEYGSERDILSKNLMAAGHAFMVYAVENHAKPFDELLEGSIQKIEEIKKVLINPLTQSTYQNPWLVESVVTWDKTTLEEHQRHAIQFSGKVIKAAPHEFAQAVISWIEQLPIQKNTSVVVFQATNLCLANPLSQEMQDYQCYLRNEHIISQSKKLQQSLEVIWDLEETALALEETNIAGFQRFEQDLSRLEQDHTQQTAEFNQRLITVQAQQQTTIALYNEANDEVKTTLSHVKTELSEAQIQMNRQQAQISSLSSQLIGCYGQLGHLQNELNNQGSCSVM